MVVLGVLSRPSSAQIICSSPRKPAPFVVRRVACCGGNGSGGNWFLCNSTSVVSTVSEHEDVGIMEAGGGTAGRGDGSPGRHAAWRGASRSQPGGAPRQLCLPELAAVS